MDHISSRFRRTRKGDINSPAPAVPDTLPVLTITTTTTTTTPPRETNANGNVLHAPKSPLRVFHNFRSSHKRQRSPKPASLPQPTSPAVVNHTGTMTENNMMSPEKGPAPAVQEVDSKEAPKIPSFLTLSEMDILEKYKELTWTERNRMLMTLADPTPSNKYGRINPQYRRFDRYQNIQPWGGNRVKLNVPEGTPDYINASPIVANSPLNPKARPPHRYIAMQGPRNNTIGHAWRMVAEQLASPAVIVMLTETHDENNIEKCWPYFPQQVDDAMEIGEEDEFGDGFRAQVKCEEIEEKANGAIEMRKLKLHVEGKEDDMEVWHLLYKKWPDFGVPALEDIDSFFDLMRLSREKNGGIDNPRIVHCSAGVGRSGTFIALEHLLREVDSGDLERYDDQQGGAEAPDLVYDTVNELREQRRLMVQAEPQYVFIYQVLRKQWMEKHGLEETTDEPAAKRLEVDNDPFVEEASG